MSKKELQLIVIHCLYTPEGRDIAAETVRYWHTAPPPGGRGWSRVGYSDMIHINGNLENLHPFDIDKYVDSWEVTNGAKGFNSISRHVAYVGGMRDGKPFDTRTDAQKATLETYVKYRILRKPDVRIAGHNQLSAKECPCFDVPTWLRSIGVSEINIYKP